MSQWAVSTLIPRSVRNTREAELHAVRTISPPLRRWDLEAFAREQIRGLVRQIFFSKTEVGVRQIVFSAMGPKTDVRPICRAVAGELARENAGSVAVMGRWDAGCSPGRADGAGDPGIIGQEQTLRSIARPVDMNCWLLPDLPQESEISAAQIHARLCDLRREFDYSIIAAPSAGDSQLTTASAQIADGIVLVVSARYTRRATAIRIKQLLETARVRILGTVLSDRDFPIPETMYRRL